MIRSNCEQPNGEQPNRTLDVTVTSNVAVTADDGALFDAAIEAACAVLAKKAPDEWAEWAAAYPIGVGRLRGRVVTAIAAYEATKTRGLLRTARGG